MTGDFTAILTFLEVAISIWLIVLFVGISRRVAAIKRMLMVAFELEEYEDEGIYGYRKKSPKYGSVQPNSPQR